MLTHVFTQAPADTRSRRYTVYTCVTIHVSYTSSLDPRPVAWLLLAIACGLVGLVEAGRLDGFAAGPAGAGAGACISSLVGGGRALARDGRCWAGSNLP